MWLLSANLPVRLEALDQTGNPIAGHAARLQQLDEEQAIMTLEEANPARCFHWGAPVRFELEDGLRRYEFTGVIVQRNLKVSGLEGDCGAGEQPQEHCEIRIRIWECHPAVQRRSFPRRKLRFQVLFRPLSEEDLTEDASGAEADWMCGWCVDIGGGGMRMQTPKLAKVPARMALEFGLPVSAGAKGTGEDHPFHLSARVIRVGLCGRHIDNMEITLRFEHLAVADGLVLKNLLS